MRRPWTRVAALAWVLAACAVVGASTPAGADPSVRPIHFTWTMPNTYGSKTDPRSLDANGLPKATAPDAVREGPWSVTFKLTEDCHPNVVYRWSVNDKPVEPKRADPCDFVVSDAFPRQGHYKVEVKAAVEGHDVEGLETVEVKDWLIVSIGDSVASGEGVPEKWSSSYARWQNDRCHRSAYAAPALAARELAVKNPTVSVTFVHLACSGATIATGLIGGYAGLVHSRSASDLPPQVDELRTLAKERTPNAVLVSIGANDVGFSSIIKRCARRFHVTSCFNKHFGQRTSIEQRVADKLALLPGLYASLSTRLSEGMRIPPAHVYLTEYFDPTGDISGEACKRVLRFGLLGLAQADLKDAQRKLLGPLNGRIADAVAQHEWREITGISNAFAKHGYCAGPQRWITTLRDSFGNQGGQGLGASFAGTLHPNYEGHEQIAQLIKEELELPLKGSCPVPVAREIAYAPSAGSGDVVPCASPMPIDLPFATSTTLGAVDAPLSILIGLAALALATLVLAAFVPPGRMRESAPAVLMTMVGAALIDLSFELRDETAQAVVLTIAGAFALIAGPALLWKIRTSRSRALIERTIEKINDDTGNEGASAEGKSPEGRTPRS
jgi:lysophospholipase L1-like esterase